ncbi:Integrase core domain-containing protein [Amphibacillus marinus]|uniref:Integrase core domain-containing protein n=1 Tax=Amphibacillus marinus TaxID=872970 RepID=A0A1H8THB7_9BACI|nr:DDE-type integrase/transposase/recombinase [Amphibacillus marinus]SEO90529.1 Integrase core domain-containing protein [Amphibacillus marinus]
MLVVNDVIKNLTTEEELRILWIDRELNYCYVTDITNEKATPIRVNLKKIEEDLYNNIYSSAEDNFLARRLAGYKIKEKDIQIRDRAWLVIKKIVKEQPDIYEKKTRVILIKEATKEFGVSNKTIIKYLRKYWQRGQVINSLLPDYINCGNKGDIAYRNKTGRPREHGGGILITESIKEVFRKSINKYYLTKSKPSLTHAYEMMIKDYFKEGYIYTENKKKMILKDEKDIPSYRQFSYWYKKMYGLEDVIKKREGEAAYERNHRKLLGSTEYDSLGPGSLYQIDATPADIFLLNRFNKNWLVGKPTLYFVIDVFSRMITGFYISLNNASWISMATALQNAFSDKKEYCEKIGIEISNSDWPVKGLPSAIIGDRGELESGFADSLANGVGIEIHNNPPYRPDWKGIVEKLFHSSHELMRPLLPGYLHKGSDKRGSKDFRHEATLTLDDYIKVIVYFIKFYNHNHYMPNYERNEYMVKENVRPIPIELWNWGLKTYGNLRTLNKNLVDFYLLPTDIASITAEGIRFKSLLYSCELAIKENWFVKARKKRWKMKFSYDPRNMDVIFLHVTGQIEHETPYNVCTLLPHQEKYLNKSLGEINQLIEFEKETYNSFRYDKLTEKVNLFEQVEEIVKKATNLKKSEHDPSISKSKKITQLKSKRIDERNTRYVADSFEIENQTTRTLLQKKDNDKSNLVTQNETYSIIDLYTKQRMKKNDDR